MNGIFCLSLGILSNTAKIVLFLRWSYVAQVRFLDGPQSFLSARVALYQFSHMLMK